MDNALTFKFHLYKTYIKHLKEKSYYNHNYYEIDLDRYGDYFPKAKCNILYEDCSNGLDLYAYYSLGYFDDSGNFQACWTWLDYKAELTFLS